MDNGRTRKVLEPHLIKPAATPRPCADNGIDERGEDQRKQKERPEFDPFGQGSRYDGGRGRHEHHLEEPVRHHGVAVLDDRFFHGRIAFEQGDFLSGWTVEEFEGADPGPDVHIHQVVADRIEGEACNRVETDVFQTDDGRILGANGPGLQHGEAGAHPHHQRAPDQERKGVEDEAQISFLLSVIAVIIAGGMVLSISRTLFSV